MASRRNTSTGASSRSDGGVSLGTGARAVGDGQSGSLGDGIRLVVFDDRSSIRAVGGVGSDNLSGSEVCAIGVLGSVVAMS